MSSFTSKIPRKGGFEHKPKPTPKKNKGKAVSGISVGKKIPIIARFDLDNPNGDACTEGIELVSIAISGNREFKEGSLDGMLFYERYDFAGKSLYGLINRKEVKLLAFIAVEDDEEAAVVVLEDKVGFEAVESFLKEEGLEESQFLYYSTPAEYSLEHVSFSIDCVRDDMKIMSEMTSSNVKKFEHVYTFARLFCLFLVPAIMSEWRVMFSTKLMEHVDTDHVILLPDDYVAIWRNWGKISEFVRSDGKTVLPSEVRIKDLVKAKKHLSILKSMDMIGPFVPTNFVRAKGKHYHSLVGDSGSSQDDAGAAAAAAADTHLWSTIGCHLRTRSAPDRLLSSPPGFLLGRLPSDPSGAGFSVPPGAGLRGAGFSDPPGAGAARGAATSRGRRSLLQTAVRPLVKLAKFIKKLPK